MKPTPELEMVDPGTLAEWPGNPRRHPPRQMEELRRSIQQLGFSTPIVARPSDRRVLAGHARRAVALELGLERVPVRWLELDDARAASLVAADNRIAGLGSDDADMLADLLAGIGPVEVPGFSAGDLASLIALPHVASAQRMVAEDAEVLPHSAGAVFELKDDWAAPRCGAWELPPLRPDRLMPAPHPSDLPRVATPCHPVPGGIFIAGNGAEAHASPGGIYCTYTEDTYFQRDFEAPAARFRALLRHRPRGAIGWDFSTWGDWPFPARLWSLYRSYWCTRYAQEAGLPVWPSVSWLAEDIAASLEPIPRGAYVVWQIQTAQSRRRQYCDETARAVEILRPSGILAYADPATRGAELDHLRALCARVDVVTPAYVIRRVKRGGRRPDWRPSDG